MADLPGRATRALLPAAETERPAQDQRRRAAGVVDGRGEEAERREDGPARSPRPVRDQDEDDRDDEDDREVEVALVEPVEDRHTDEQPSDEMEPERRRLVDDGSGGEVDEADEEAHDVRPAAAAREMKSVTKSQPTTAEMRPMNGNRQIQRKARAATRTRKRAARGAPATTPGQRRRGPATASRTSARRWRRRNPRRSRPRRRRCPAASHLSATRRRPGDEEQHDEDRAAPRPSGLLLRGTGRRGRRGRRSRRAGRSGRPGRRGSSPSSRSA